VNLKRMRTERFSTRISIRLVDDSRAFCSAMLIVACCYCSCCIIVVPVADSFSVRPAFPQKMQVSGGCYNGGSVGCCSIKTTAKSSIRPTQGKEARNFTPYRFGIHPYKPLTRQDDRELSMSEGNATTLPVNATSGGRKSFLDDIRILDEDTSRIRNSKNQASAQSNETSLMNGDDIIPANSSSLLNGTVDGGDSNNKTDQVSPAKQSIKQQEFSWPDLSQYFPAHKPSSSAGNMKSSSPKFDGNNSSKVPKSGGEDSDSDSYPTSLEITVQDLLQGKSPTDALTATDLQSMLAIIAQLQASAESSSRGIIESQLEASSEPFSRGIIESYVKNSTSPKSSVSKTPSSKKSPVAFPQPSVLDAKSLRWGTTAASSTLGLLVGLSVLPNLWLIGAVFGAFYGYGLGKQQEEQENPPSQFVQLAIVNLGRRLANAYLQVYDYANALFFMYKTGQLSYDYYQRYADLDQRFAIQSKVDAWNARFAEGKINFDRHVL
jgi:hypothetical protein